jgi:hypothetical protein
MLPVRGPPRDRAATLAATVPIAGAAYPAAATEYSGLENAVVRYRPFVACCVNANAESVRSGLAAERRPGERRTAVPARYERPRPAPWWRVGAE